MEDPRVGLSCSWSGEGFVGQRVLLVELAGRVSPRGDGVGEMN